MIMSKVFFSCCCCGFGSPASTTNKLLLIERVKRKPVRNKAETTQEQRGNDKLIDRLVRVGLTAPLQSLDALVEPRLELGVLEQVGADVSQFHHVVRAVVVRVVHETLVVGLKKLFFVLFRGLIASF